MSPERKSARNVRDVESDRPGRPGRRRASRRKQASVQSVGVIGPPLAGSRRAAVDRGDRERDRWGVDDFDIGGGGRLVVRYGERVVSFWPG
jgi:hypothetical protein